MTAKKKAEQAVLARKEAREPALPAIALKKGVVMQEDFGKFLAEYKAKMTGVRNEALRIFWGLGAHVHAMLDESVYGDHRIDEVCEELEVSKSTLYGYKRLYEVYEILDIERFIKHGIGFHTIYQLLRLKDGAVRKAMEAKLIKKEIKAADLGRLIAEENGTEDDKGGKANMQADGSDPEDEDEEAEAVEVAEPESEGQLVEDAPDPSQAEAEAEKDAPPADKAAADKIRSVTNKVNILVKSLTIALDQLPAAVGAFDMVSDMKLGESLQGRMSDTQGDLIDLKAKIGVCVESLKKVCI